MHEARQATSQGPMTMTVFETCMLNHTYDTSVFGSLTGAGQAMSEQELLAASPAA